MRNYIVGGLVGGLGVPVLFSLSLLLGWVPLNADTSPHPLEVNVARWVKEASLGRATRGLKPPFGEEVDPADVQDGQTLYGRNCKGCHGAFFGEPAERHVRFFPPVPLFGRTPPGGNMETRFWVIKHGLRFSAMPAFGGVLSDIDIWRIALFLSHFRGESPAME